MKHIGNELNKILSNNKMITKKEFARDQLGMTDVNLSKILKKDSIDAKLLERISKALEVPISFWFDESLVTISQNVHGDKNQVVSGNGHWITLSDKNELQFLENEIDHLKQIIEEKERLIQVLMNKG